MSDLDEGLGQDRFLLSAPPPRTYQGWHLPRKQVIRHAHWCRPLNDLLESRPDPTKVVKYLGLPGRDLLDVRSLLLDVCEPYDRQLLFLGFERAAAPGTDDNSLLNSAFADLMREPRVVAGSSVRADDVALLANMSTRAFDEARNLAPFDIINLDYCEAVWGQSPYAPSSIYALLKRVFTLQRTSNEWLLLITSRVLPETFEEDALAALLQLVRENHDACEAFATVLRRRPWVAERLGAEDATDLPADKLFMLTPLLIGKWLLREASKVRSRLKVVGLAGYRVRGEGSMDMLSLAIRVTPDYRIGGDDAGFVQADQIDECEEAARLAERVEQLDDVDKYLASDAAVLLQFAQASVDLMAAANHPIEPYLEFLREAGVDIDLLAAESGGRRSAKQASGRPK